MAEEQRDSCEPTPPSCSAPGVSYVSLLGPTVDQMLQMVGAMFVPATGAMEQFTRSMQSLAAVISDSMAPAFRELGKMMAVKDCWRLTEDRIVVACDFFEWVQWYQSLEQHPGLNVVNKEKIDDTEISTVFLPLNKGIHRYRLFETLVMGGELDGQQARSASWEEAKHIHAVVRCQVMKAMMRRGTVGKTRFIRPLKESSDGNDGRASNTVADGMQEGAGPGTPSGQAILGGGPGSSAEVPEQTPPGEDRREEEGSDGGPG